MAETPLGITYPGPGDHTRLWEHYQNLAESVDGLLSDEWHPLTITGSGWTVAGGNTPQACHVGGLVIVRGMVANASFSGGYTTVGELPSEVPYPTQNQVFSALANTGSVRAVQITTAGAVQVYVSVASSAWLPIQGVYRP